MSLSESQSWNVRGKKKQNWYSTSWPFSLTFSNEQESLFTFSRPLTGVLLLTSLRLLLVCFSQWSMLRKRLKRKWKGGEERPKETEVLIVQILPQWHPSQQHQSHPDTNGCFRFSASQQCPNPPEPPPTTSYPCTPLNQHGKGAMTQKWVETNDSNESCCPPANVCSHYRWLGEWIQSDSLLSQSLHITRLFIYLICILASRVHNICSYLSWATYFQLS